MTPALCSTGVMWVFADGADAPSFYLKATMLVALACLWLADVVFARHKEKS